MTRPFNTSRCVTAFSLLISFIITGFAQSEDMRERILSRDYNVAQKALEENVLAKDVKAVCLSLWHRAQSLKIKAADALGLLRSQEAVGCLTEALKDNLAYRPHDTESTLLRDQLNKSLIASLRAITGLRLPTKNKYLDSDIEKVIKRIEKR